MTPRVPTVGADQSSWGAVLNEYLSTAHSFVTSPTYGDGHSFGNTPGSFGFAGTGAPADIYAPLVVYQRYGDYTNGTGAAIPKTTQAAFFYANYYGPTTDDAPEAVSAAVALKSLSGLGGSAFTTTKPLTAIEGIATVEGANNLTGGTARSVGVGARFNNGTGTVTEVNNFYIGAQANSGTITNWYGLRQAATPPGTVTNKWGAYLLDTVQTETHLRVAKSANSMDFQANIASHNAGAGIPAFVHIQNPDSTNFASLRIDAITGQTQPALVVFDSTGGQGATISRLGSYITTVGFFAQNSGGTTFAGMNTDGVFTSKNAAPVDGNVSAGQCFIWFDQTNGAAKLMIKGKSANGTVVTGQVALA
jgi:hypothetical protein